MSMTILSPGMLTTVQDLGRFGHQNSGFPVSGALDRRALMLGNLLLGNPPGEAGLEMTMLGASIEFGADTCVSLTGADMAATLNGAPAPRYTAFPVHAGDVLRCGAAISGCRSYLCVAGGIDVPVVMGSKSTYMKCAVGGLEGRKLRRGDVLPLTFPRPELYDMPARTLPKEADRPYPQVLRVILGPQDDYFTEHGIRTFFSSGYTVTADSDRMGVRFDGLPIEAKNGMDIISDGIPLGGIQVPSSGKPIILLADRQTTGGYAKIGTVLSCDLPALAQARPGAVFGFMPISVRDGQRAYRQEMREMEHLRLIFAS